MYEFKNRLIAVGLAVKVVRVESRLSVSVGTTNPALSPGFHGHDLVSRTFVVVL